MSLHGSTLALLIAAVLATSASCKTKPQAAPVEQKQTALPKDGVPFNDAVSVEAGRSETCVITSLGALYCAGGEPFGYHPERVMARKVKLAPHTRQVSLGIRISCAVQEDGALICWGGVSTRTMPDDTPPGGYARIPGITSVTHVFAPRGAFLPWVLRRDSSVPMICGGNTLDPGFVPPHEAKGVRVAGSEVEQVTVGWDLCARTTANQVLCWDGSGERDGTYELKNPVRFLPAKIIDIAGGWQSDNTSANCALSEDGRAVCWGYQKHPQPAAHFPDEGVTVTDVEHPFETESDWRDLAMAYDHSCGVKRDGSVWCIGRNNKGQLGAAEPAHSDHFVRVPGVANAKAVSVGRFHSCALLTSGSVMCWGENDWGQCGAATRSETCPPTVMLKHTGPDDP